MEYRGSGGQGGPELACEVNEAGSRESVGFNNGEREAACFGRGQPSTVDTRNGVPCYTVALAEQTGDAVGLRMVTAPVLHKELSLSRTDTPH
ncbi:MAG: hypothetical protein ACPIOQ_25740, partial [Promethearchaeia archaeon]